jgi:hypothetical protein
MAVDQNTLDALRLDSLVVPADLKVEDLRVEEYTDHDGDDALRVTIVLADDTDFSQGIGGKLNTLIRSINDNLLQRGVTLFPYTRISTPRGAAEAAEHAAAEAAVGDEEE